MQLKGQRKEAAVNDNPWHVDDMARMQRERIREEMKQIRLQESARRVFPSQPSWLMSILVKVLAPIQRLLNPPASRRPQSVQRTITMRHSKRQSHL